MNTPGNKDYESGVRAYKLAVGSIVFPFLTFLLAFGVRLYGISAGSGALALWPLALVTILLLGLGFGIGILRGMAALQAVGDIPSQNKPKVFVTATIGVVISFSELWYLVQILS